MNNRLLSPACLDAMVSNALRMAQEIGIATNRQDLLQKASALPGLTVRGERIHVAPEVIHELLERNRVEAPASRPRPDGPIINVASRALMFADHHAWEIRPLTRADVIAGSKLIDALSSRGVVGTTCGIPQDAIPPLQPLEHYLIGYRHSRNGGATPMPPQGDAARYLTEMREIAEEGFDPQRRHVSVWVPSPLRLEGNELDELLDSGVEPLSLYVGAMPLMGLTGPADPVGVYTLALAETLGGTAILHRLYPEAKATIYPHPEPMDLHSGMMAVGTVEWARLELMQKEIMEHLGLEPHRMDVLTSACMPGVQAQMDKSTSVTMGVMHGYTRFNMFPLCTDEAHSHAQVVLDVETVLRAWEGCRQLAGAERAESAFETVSLAVAEGLIVGSMEDTARHLRSNYARSPLPRVYSSGQWNDAGRPSAVDDAEAYARELIGKADYAPPGDRFLKVVDVYRRACRALGVEPMALD